MRQSRGHPRQNLRVTGRYVRSCPYRGGLDEKSEKNAPRPDAPHLQDTVRQLEHDQFTLIDSVVSLVSVSVNDPPLTAYGEAVSDVTLACASTPAVLSDCPVVIVGGAGVPVTGDGLAVLGEVVEVLFCLVHAAIAIAATAAPTTYANFMARFP